MLQSRRSCTRWFIQVNQILNASTCFLYHVFVVYQLCSVSASFEWFRFPKGIVFYLFLSMGARAQVRFFSPNFDVIKTKEAEMEPVYQRWSPRWRPWPREHIFKSLALASKPQVLENFPVLGSKTALFFEWLKFCRSVEKCFSRPFFL